MDKHVITPPKEVRDQIKQILKAEREAIKSAFRRQHSACGTKGCPYCDR